MPRSRLLVPAAILMLAGGPASAQERQADNAPVAAPAATEAVQFPALSPEFAVKLASGEGKLSAADREDRAALAKIYEARRSEPLWVTSTGLTPSAAAIVAEIGRAGDWGLDAAAFTLPALSPSGAPELTLDQRIEADVAISLAVLKYARHARGGRAEPTSLSRNLDRKLSLLEPARVIDEAAASSTPAAYLRGLHPKHPQFELLRQKYLALRSGQPAPQAAAAAPAAAKATPGKQKATGATEPPNLRKLLVNMEQWRWMPERLGELYVWVNIPEFTVRIVKGDRVIHTERAIVGKADTQTPVFSDEIEQVIFHPFWGVPDSIKRNEILPSLARGSSRVLERHNLRIQRGGRDVDPASIDWATTDIRNFHVYQPPGGGNVLGVVKFRFPNKHDVYMHDTPTKNLFNASVRTFSHGCMRIREPQRLAEILLAEDKGWPASRVASAITSGPQNNHVNLTQKFPVHMTYFTAWVDDDGKLKSFPDIYGHETRIALGMEGKAHLIARSEPPRPDVVGRLADTKTGGASKKDWINRVFDN